MWATQCSSGSLALASRPSPSLSLSLTQSQNSYWSRVPNQLEGTNRKALRKALTISLPSTPPLTIYASLDFWFSAHTTYSVEGMMTAAPIRVVKAGISAKNAAPTAADHISSVYLTDANSGFKVQGSGFRFKG